MKLRSVHIHAIKPADILCHIRMQQVVMFAAQARQPPAPQQFAENIAEHQCHKGGFAQERGGGALPCQIEHPERMRIPV
jgi:hypothetical protein